MSILKPAFFLSLAVAAPAAFTADQIHWTLTGQTSVAFDWRGTEDTLYYGTSPGNYTDQVVANQPNLPSPSPTSSSGPFREVRITGLQEDTLYYYAIGSGPEHTFRTPSARGNADFTVFAEGDVGASNNVPRMAAVQELIANGAPHFVLVVGDITYGESNVARVDQHFNDVMVWSQDAAYMPAWGNHDWDAVASTPDQINNYEGRFFLPNSRTSPGASTAIGNGDDGNGDGVAGDGEDWYWFDHGNTRFIAYPEPFTSATWPDWNTQAQALMDAAQRDSNIDFIVTFGHRPAYSSGHHAGSSNLKGILDALGDTHGKYVLNVNGHSHNYERSYPQHGVVHITAGMGGRNLEQDGACLWRECTQPAWSAFRAMYHGALRLSFTTAGIQGEFICGPAGGTTSNINDISCNPSNVADSFTIGTPSGGDTTPPEVGITAPVSGDTVAGTITVSADATDDNGDVAGVQFKLNGNNLGAEDTTDPYSVSWNTTTVANGAHTLTARARDPAGNYATSAPVTAMVNNPITVSFAPVADATLKADSPDTNYGSASTLGVDNSPERHCLMKFVVSGLTRPVASAKLRLYNVDKSAKGGDFY